MDRALWFVTLSIMAALALPGLAVWLQAALPLLISLLVILGLARLVWPDGRRR